MTEQTEGRKRDGRAPTIADLPEALSDNIDAVADFYARQEGKLSRPRNVIERVTDFAGRPLYLGCILLFVGAWIFANTFSNRFGWVQFDPPPFIWLQGIVGLSSLIVGTAVLIKQVRMARLSEHHAHLDLQVNLLAERKATKIIQLLEELRRDLPSVDNRRDTEVEEMQKPTDPGAVLDAIEGKIQSTEDDIT